MDERAGLPSEPAGSLTAVLGAVQQYVRLHFHLLHAVSITRGVPLP